MRSNPRMVENLPCSSFLFVPAHRLSSHTVRIRSQRNCPRLMASYEYSSYYQSASGKHRQWLLSAKHLTAGSRGGHRNLLVAGLSGNHTPHLEGVELRDCRFVRFSHRDLDFTIPGMSDVMPSPSSLFRDLSGQRLDQYRRAFAGAMKDIAGTSIMPWLSIRIRPIGSELCTTFPQIASPSSAPAMTSTSFTLLKNRPLHPFTFCMPGN